MGWIIVLQIKNRGYSIPQVIHEQEHDIVERKVEIASGSYKQK